MSAVVQLLYSFTLLSDSALQQSVTFIADGPESGHCVPLFLSLTNWLTRSMIGWNLLYEPLTVENCWYVGFANIVNEESIAL